MSENQQAPMSALEINEIYCLLDRTFLSEFSVAKPQKLYTAVSVVCDIECPYCPRQIYDKSFYKHGLMNYKNFQRLSPHFENAEYIGLFGLGEPFLHPKFFEFVKSVKDEGGPVATSSHGMSLTPEVIDKIIDLQIDKLAISMDGPTAKIFHRLRAGAKFETVCKNVKKLIDRRNERGSKKPSVTIACTVSRHNFRYMEQMVDLAYGFGADELTFADLILCEPEDAHLSVHAHPAFQKRLAKAKAKAAKLGLTCQHYKQFPYLWLNQKHTHKPGRYGCSEAYRTYEIDREGVVNPCCYIEENYGNVFEEDLGVLPNHSERVRLRKGMIDNQPHRTCGSCQYYTRNSPKRVDDILKEVEMKIDDPRLPNEEKVKLNSLLEDYRKKSETFFDGFDDTEYVEDESLVLTFK